MTSCMEAGLRPQMPPPLVMTPPARAQWSFATLRYYPAAAIETLCEGVWARRAELNAQEVCNIVWALARLGHHPGRMLAGLDPYLTARIPEMTRQGVSNLLWALAVLQARLSAKVSP